MGIKMLGNGCGRKSPRFSHAGAQCSTLWGTSPGELHMDANGVSARAGAQLLLVLMWYPARAELGMVWVT